MKLLLFSDVHCDPRAARSLVERSRAADVLVCAGDLAVMRRGLKEMVRILAEAAAPTVLVAGNAESDRELADACVGWKGAHVLHGSACEIDGVPFWGVGGAVPVTPFGSWSFDLDEEQARVLLDHCPEEAVLVTHSPPLGHVDEAGGRHLGSQAVLETVKRARPRLVVCGHIHSCWGRESALGATPTVNAGPAGVWSEL